MNVGKKGFTLVEVIAAVTILGILSIVAISAVTKVIQNAKDSHYTTAEEQLELAGQSYVQQNRSSLPKSIGQKTQIKLSTLVEQNYIEKIKDYSDNECDLDKSYVQIFKYSENNYSYLAHLECPSYTTQNKKGDGKPEIVITMSDSKETKIATSEIKIVDSAKLLSWSYIIYKNGKEVKNSGSIPLKNYDTTISKTLKLSDYTPGKIKVVVTATNIYGITTKKTSSEVEYADTQSPKCIIKDVDKNPKPWTKGPVTVTVGCDDKNGTGCTREEYTKTFKTTTEKGKIKIEDNSGNTTDCEVSVNIDLIKPTLTVKAYKRGKNGKPTGSAIGTITADDKNSTKTLDLSNVNTTKWLNNSSNPYGVYYEVTYTDGHSNITYEAKENSPNLLSNAANVNTMTTIESKSINSTTASRNYETTEDGHRLYILTATDEAGNTTRVQIEAPLDRVTPDIPQISNESSGNWTNKAFSLTLKSRDTLSGIDSFQYTYKKSATNTSTNSSNGWVKYSNSSSSQNEEKEFKTPNFSKQRNQDVYIRACDRAGNCSDPSSTPIKIDLTSPKCNVSGGSSTWINSTSPAKERKITATCSDTFGECATDPFSTTYKDDIDTDKAGAAGINNGGTVRDKAGNETQCAADKKVKIDKTNPTCTIKKTNTDSEAGVTLTTTCTDATSKVKTCQSKQTGIKTSKTYTVTDNAGNSNTCSVTVGVQTQTAKSCETCNYTYSCPYGKLSGTKCVAYDKIEFTFEKTEKADVKVQVLGDEFTVYGEYRCKGYKQNGPVTNYACLQEYGYQGYERTKTIFGGYEDDDEAYCTTLKPSVESGTIAADKITYFDVVGTCKWKGDFDATETCNKQNVTSGDACGWNEKQITTSCTASNTVKCFYY